MTYDVLNHPLTVTDPLGRVTTLSYDLNENLIFLKDPLNRTTASSYAERDLLFKVVDANVPAGVTARAYDANGNLKSITDANSRATTYTVDLFDRLTKRTYPDAKFETIVYDLLGNVTSVTTPGGKVINFFKWPPEGQSTW